MPRARDIAPYLDRIDQSGWYSNFGPLVSEFEARLEARLEHERAQDQVLLRRRAGADEAAVLDDHGPRAWRLEHAADPDSA